MVATCGSDAVRSTSPNGDTLMNMILRKSTIGLFALGTAWMMPLAFAQSANTTSQSVPAPPPAAMTIAPTPATPAISSDTPTAPAANMAAVQAADAAVATSTAASPPATGKTAAKKTWSELDANKDGNISKPEAAADPGLKRIFAKADANTDGMLTVDEYKAYVAANYQVNATPK